MNTIYANKNHSIFWSPDLWFSETKNLNITETCLYDEITNREWQLQRMNRQLNMHELGDIKKGKFKDANFDRAFNKLLQRNLVMEKYNEFDQVFYVTSMCELGRNRIIGSKKYSENQDINLLQQGDSTVITSPSNNEINKLEHQKPTHNTNNKIKTDSRKKLLKTHSQEDIDQHERIEKSKIALFGKHNS